MSGKVQVQRTVTRGGATFQQHFWVNPSDVKDTDVVIGKPTTDTTARKDFYGAGNFVRLSSSDFSKDMERVKKAPIGCTVKLKYGDKSEEYARKTGDNEWSVDGKKKPLSNNAIASVAYDSGTVLINTMVRQSDSNKKDSNNPTDKAPQKQLSATSNTTKAKARKVSNMDDLQNGIRSINRAIGKEHNILNAVSLMGGGKLGEQLAYVSIPKLQTESNAKKVIDEQLKREFGDSVKYSLTKESNHFVVSLKLDDNKTSSDKAPTKPSSGHIIGKNMTELVSNLKAQGYEMDAADQRSPQDKVTLFKDGKEYEAEVTKYPNGDYEILGSSIKEVKNDADTKKDESDKPKLTDPTTPMNPSDIKVGDYIYYEDNEGAGGIKGVTQVKEIKKVVIPKTGKTMYVFNEHGRHDRVSCLEGKTIKKYDTKSKQDDKSSNTSTDVKQDSDKKSGKFSMSEFTKLKSDRPKALQYLKDNGVSWKETDNEGINWMRACMAASRAENSAQGATKKDSAGKSSSDSKSTRNSSNIAKKSIVDLLTSHGGDRAKVMQIAKASGVTWKESDNAGINWMRASLAIQKHYESGNTISATKSQDDSTKTDDKKDDTGSKPTKVTISDLKKPTSNGTSTELKIGNYTIIVTKHRNVGTNAKQHPSFYRIDVEKNGKNGGNVFRTDKTDWKDIKYHAQRYIDDFTSSDTKTDDKKSDSKPTHDNPLVTTETKSGKPYQIWESNGRIYGSLPGQQNSRDARAIKDFTGAGFDTLDEVKDYIKKYF